MKLLLASLLLISSLGALTASAFGNEPIGLRHAQVKNGKAGFERRFVARGNGSPVFDEDLGLWFAPVTVGKKTLNMLVDTGSDATFVGKGNYSPGPKSKDLHETTTGFFGADKIQAEIFNDDVTFNEMSGYGAILSGTTSLSDRKDGVFGLSPANGAGKGDTTNPLQAYADSGKWKDQEFVLDLQYDKSSLTFSSPKDKDKFLYTSYGQINKEHYIVSGNVNGLGTEAHIDSGSNGVFMSTNNLKKLGVQLNYPVKNSVGSPQLYGKCADSPKVTFGFGEHKIPFNPNYFWKASGDGDDKCYSAIYALESLKDNELIFGVPFFLTARVAFDIKNHQIGASTT